MSTFGMIRMFTIYMYIYTHTYINPSSYKITSFDSNTRQKIMTLVYNLFSHVVKVTQISLEVCFNYNDLPQSLSYCDYIP